uniref:Uncharacterized protein n=1 Tax=Panagrolaimus superbus TaxID=310955 RepID=A0A914XZ64_9BILA
MTSVLIECEEEVFVNTDLPENVYGDTIDYNLPLGAHTFTIGWIIKSLRENDKTFIKLHGNRGISNTGK